MKLSVPLMLWKQGCDAMEVDSDLWQGCGKGRPEAAGGTEAGILKVFDVRRDMFKLML